MARLSDSELGTELRRWHCNADKQPLTRGVVLDLISEDRALQPALLDLIGRPTFRSLEPLSITSGSNILRRDLLLREIEEVYQPRVVDRIRNVLNSYLDINEDYLHQPTNANHTNPTQASFRDHKQLGIAKIKQEDYKGAIEELSRALQLNSEDAEVYSARGWAKYAVEDFSGAFDDYSQVLQLEPNDASALHGRGSANGHLEKYHDAILDFNEALRLAPDYCDLDRLYYDRAWAKNRLGDHAGAIDDCSHVLRINPNDSDAYYLRGLARHCLGDNEAALHRPDQRQDPGRDYDPDLPPPAGEAQAGRTDL